MKVDIVNSMQILKKSEKSTAFEHNYYQFQRQLFKSNA